MSQLIVPSHGREKFTRSPAQEIVKFEHYFGDNSTPNCENYSMTIREGNNEVNYTIEKEKIAVHPCQVYLKNVFQSLLLQHVHLREVSVNIKKINLKPKVHMKKVVVQIRKMNLQPKVFLTRCGDDYIVRCPGNVGIALESICKPNYYNTRQKNQS